MGRTRPPDAAVEQRRQAILRTVVELGEMRIDDLPKRFDVSLMTVHRDLDDLAERRLVRKLRGRVAAYPALTMETAKRFREGLRVAEKEALCERAVREVVPGQTVFLDDSTTLFPLARRVADLELTVVTNSLEVARLVGDRGRAEVIVLGGRYTEFDSCIGPDVLSALARLCPDVGFASVTAVAGGRLYHPTREYAQLKEAALRAAKRNVLVVDHSKLGKTATYAYGEAGEYDLVLVDDQAPTEEIEALHGSSARVVLVGAAAEHGSAGT